jgi:hypothetical protein
MVRIGRSGPAERLPGPSSGRAASEAHRPCSSLSPSREPGEAAATRCSRLRGTGDREADPSAAPVPVFRSRHSVRSRPQPRHAVGRRVGSALREMARGSRPESARSRERGRPGCPGGEPRDRQWSLPLARWFRGSRLAPDRGDEGVTRRRVAKDRRPNEPGVPITRSDAARHELRSACLAVPARPGRSGGRIGAAAGRDLADAPPVRWGSHGCRATIARSPSGARMTASGSRTHVAEA